MSPQRSYLQSWDGKLQIVDRTSRRSKVKYIINRPRYVDKLADVVADELEIGVLSAADADAVAFGSFRTRST